MSAHPERIACKATKILLVSMVLLVGGFAQAGLAAAEDRWRERRLPEGPSIGPHMSVRERFALRAAFEAAVRAVERNAACGALFDGLRLDGLEALHRSRYRTVASPGERAHCAPTVAAVAEVGGNRILICWRFHDLGRLNRVATLIHEALHTAGLGEWPHDPHGMTPKEITERVKRECGL